MRRGLGHSNGGRVPFAPDRPPSGLSVPISSLLCRAFLFLLPAPLRFRGEACWCANVCFKSSPAFRLPGPDSLGLQRRLLGVWRKYQIKNSGRISSILSLRTPPYSTPYQSLRIKWPVPFPSLSCPTLVQTRPVQGPVPAAPRTSSL